jgi:carbonic anhydrase/acetyltransferase-like protein (isoleucine patch superfamily)
MSPELPPLLCLGYQGARPEFAAPPRCGGAGTAVCGRVRIGPGAQLGAHAVIRGDGHEIHIGEDFFLGERSTVHVAHERLPTVVGGGVTVGRHAVLRACRLGERCVVEDKVLVLEDAWIGPGCVIERNSLVPAGARLEGGLLYRGIPVRPVRPLEPGELLLMRNRVRHAATAVPPPLRPAAAAPVGGFVAPTAQLDGRLQLGAAAGVWFGTQLDGGHQGIEIGAGSALHDNCVAYAISQPLRIGADVSVEHNVALHDCRIGDRSLIGAGCFLAAGTEVEAEVLLAAGSITLPRQHLHGGWHWGGRPARPLAPLAGADRERIAEVARIWRDYAGGFRRALADFADDAW